MILKVDSFHMNCTGHVRTVRLDGPEEKKKE